MISRLELIESFILLGWEWHVSSVELLFRCLIVLKWHLWFVYLWWVCWFLGSLRWRLISAKIGCTLLKIELNNPGGVRTLRLTQLLLPLLIMLLDQRLSFIWECIRWRQRRQYRLSHALLFGIISGDADTIHKKVTSAVVAVLAVWSWFIWHTHAIHFVVELLLFLLLLLQVFIVVLADLTEIAHIWTLYLHLRLAEISEVVSRTNNFWDTGLLLGLLEDVLLALRVLNYVGFGAMKALQLFTIIFDKFTLIVVLG